LSAISVFDTQPSSSKLQCASSCLDNLVGMCGMFVWNSEKSEISLISRIIRNKKYENTIQLKIRDTTYVTFILCSYTKRRDCTKS
jgi:hypothetical protein